MSTHRPLPRLLLVGGWAAGLLGGGAAGLLGGWGGCGGRAGGDHADQLAHLAVVGELALEVAGAGSGEGHCEGATVGGAEGDGGDGSGGAAGRWDGRGERRGGRCRRVNRVQVCADDHDGRIRGGGARSPMVMMDAPMDGCARVLGQGLRGAVRKAGAAWRGERGGGEVSPHLQSLLERRARRSKKR